MCGDQEEGPKGTIVVEGTSEGKDKEQGRLGRMRGVLNRHDNDLPSTERRVKIQKNLESESLVTVKIYIKSF